MKVVVCVKQVAALGDEVEFTADGRDVDPDFLEHALNEWDAYSTEAALRIREALGSGEVVAVTVGGGKTEAVLRRCLAMGADRGVRIESPAADPFAIARALASVVERERPELVLCGVQSSDSVQAATGAALAGLLDLPCVAVVTKVDVGGDGRGSAHRELEGGLLDVVDFDLPAVLTIQTGINEPRYATLRAIKQAEQQEIEVLSCPAGEPAYSVRRMFVPVRGEGAEMLSGSPAQIAARIAEIVNERLA